MRTANVRFPPKADVRLPAMKLPPVTYGAEVHPDSRPQWVEGGHL